MKRALLVVAACAAAAAALLLFVFRVNYDAVVAERMIDFERAEPNSRMEWKDKEAVRAFEYAFRFASKEPGTVDIGAPPYAVTLGDSRYLLYLSPDYGKVQFMKPGNTGTLYTVRPSSADELKQLVSEADKRYGEQGSVQARLDPAAFSGEERPFVRPL
ncbi:hypothetical protein [Paenibacillus arenilitoris]|uniref:YhfM-like domain-containing protein n=1 Tax=Paenibacillus arenilitoris TaxID=2772299 RepID=A0A927CIH4_9BACL|nr:hypothetical protein [Paenibacillus arenilitoris]MBD2868119.1 hypothetical protein [Paenibacillus arenilitoris]